MLVALGPPELLGDVPELRLRDLPSFPDPPLERGGGAPLREPEAEDPGPEVLVGGGGCRFGIGLGLEGEGEAYWGSGGEGIFRV